MKKISNILIDSLYDLCVWSTPILVLISAPNYNLCLLSVIIMIIVIPIYMVYEMNKEINKIRNGEE